jgi:hypothetical protein
MNRARVDTIQLRCRADRLTTAREVDRALRLELTATNGSLVAELDTLTELFGQVEHICVRRLAVVLRLRVSRATGASGIRRAWLAAAHQAVRSLPVSGVRRVGDGVLASADGEVVIYERHVDVITDLVLSLSGSGFHLSGTLAQGLEHALGVEQPPSAGRTQDAGLVQNTGWPWDAVRAPDLGRRRDPGRRRDESARDGERAGDSEPAWNARRSEDVDGTCALERAPDLQRAWAWEQCGVYSGSLPRSAADRAEVIIQVLTAAPDLIPAVLARVDASLPLTPMQWVALALAWTRSQGSTEPRATASPIVADGPIVHAALQSPVGRALAADPKTVGSLPRTERRLLARLALASSVPHHSRDAAMDVVAETLSNAATPADLQPTASVQPQGRELHLTEYGGLLFLALAIDPVVLNIVVDDLPDVLARLCGRLTMVPPTDPVVLALAGIDPHKPPAARDDELDALVEERIRSWIRARLQLDPAADDLDWVWRRRASLEISPGYIEAEFSHDDVDLRIRRVLLDADPGWLWWRGAVLRYRYV